MVLVGVTDRGVVLLTEGAALRWDELVWTPPAGPAPCSPWWTRRAARSGPPHQGREPAGFGHAGLELHTGNVPQRWLGEIVDGAARLRFQIPEDVEPGPRRRLGPRDPLVGGGQAE